MIKVYHGSYAAIEAVDLTLCETGKDFGQGFYVTRLYEQAEIWAKRKSKQSGGIVTGFEFNENICRMMKLKVLRFDDYNDEWLDFVVLNRKNDSDRQAHDCDIVEGPVANDRITTQVDRFIEGRISRKQFLNDLIYRPSHQICFCTVQSLQALTLSKGGFDIDVYSAGDQIVQALMTDYGITEPEAIDLYCTSGIYARLSDESTGLYRQPGHEIYAMLKSELKI
jgi:hypothetical protein